MDTQLIISDVDGTLIDQTEEISQAFNELSEKVKAEKIPFTIASGRCYSELKAFIEYFIIQLPVVVNKVAGDFKNGKLFAEQSNNVKHPLLVPIINRPDAKRMFGHSRISRACMDITDSAVRTLKRSEISAEFFSFPQKYVVGTSQESDPLDKWKATISSLIEITKDDDGDVPSFGQFQQQSMAPHLEQLRMFAGLFAGETGLTIDDLGFPSDNPSSAEAIKSSHENLRLIARKSQRTFGTAFLNVGYIAACLRDDFPYERRQFYLTKPTWEPIFEPDAAALSSYGDGAIKINQAIPGYFDEKRMRDLTGF